MFREDRQGNLEYISKNDRIYSLLEGVTNKGNTSDIVFIFREATPDEMDNDYYGEVISWCYGGFDDEGSLEFIKNKIEEYEKTLDEKKD